MRSTATSPVSTERIPTLTTHEGAVGYQRDPKSELFLLAVSNMVGQDTYYERADVRDSRYAQLVRALAVDDPDWTVRLLGWLRNVGNMRSASLVGAAEFVKARLDTPSAGDDTGKSRGWKYHYRGWSRQAVDAVLQRADEPGEMLAYWTSTYGRAIPKPVKRGVADAVCRLYTEHAVLKYDTSSKGFRFGDVIKLVHAAPATTSQGNLFQHIIDRRHGRDQRVSTSLPMLWRHDQLTQIPVAARPGRLRQSGFWQELRQAGMTWEALAGWLQGPMDASAWEAIIPSMGLMALVRNLRNFDEAGVSDAAADTICARLADPDEVRKSRQFPFRFWSAYKHAPSLRWAGALEKALNHALSSVPRLPGRTLVLVDRSPSMFPGYFYSTPNKSDIPLAEQAAVFGAAIASRAQDATLIEFGGTSRNVTVPRGGSVLRLIESFGQLDGTDIPSAVRQHYAAHSRVVVVTDEQTRPGYLPSNMGRYGGMRETRIDDLIPAHIPVYMWNMAGYRPGAAPSGGRNRHAFGGLSDAAFRMIPLLEAGDSATWPF